MTFEKQKRMREQKLRNLININNPQLLLKRKIKIHLKRLKMIEVKREDGVESVVGVTHQPTNSRKMKSATDQSLYDALQWNQAMVDLQEDILLEQKLNYLEQLYNGKIPEKVLYAVLSEMKEKDTSMSLERRIINNKILEEKDDGMCMLRLYHFASFILLVFLVVVSLILWSVLGDNTYGRGEYDTENLDCYECTECSKKGGIVYPCRYSRSLCTLQFPVDDPHDNGTFKACVEWTYSRKVGCELLNGHVVCFCDTIECNAVPIMVEGSYSIKQAVFPHETISAEEFRKIVNG